MPGPIPEKISHDEFLVAVKPLLDLLNVTPNEIFSRIIIGPSEGFGLGTIEFYAAARAEGDEGDRPEGQFNLPGLAERPQPHTELAWPVRVEMV